MWCLRVRKLISAFLDRELDSETSTKISTHFRRCGWCRKEFERVEEGARLARETQQVAVPPADLALAAAIQASTRLPVHPSRRSSRILIPMAVAAILLVGLSVLNSSLWKNFPPLNSSNNVVYALDFGFNAPKQDEDLLNALRERYAGKFRELTWEGKPDPNWVPYRIKIPSKLPPRVSLKRAMIFDPRYCGSLALIYSDGSRKLCLVQQPADRPISLSGLKTTTEEVCKYNATHGQFGSYTIITWTADNLRSILISNLNRDEIESTVASLQFLSQ